MSAVGPAGSPGHHRSVVAIGVFDGVHRGHVAILRRAVERARAQGLRCIVVSFDPHPDVVLAKTFRARPPLTPLPEKRARLALLGVDELDLLPFTRELAALSPEAFVERYLIERHQPAALVVGENFALGRDRAGDVRRLAAIGAARGFEVEPVALESIDGEPVSSTRIRRLLESGGVAEAARLLGRHYELAGRVVRGEGIGRTLGVPTANLRLEDEKLVPGDGVYAVWSRIPGHPEPLPAAMSIGMRPTFDGQSRSLEVHVLDWEGDLRGQEIGAGFVDWLRPERRFETPEALVVAMREDLERARERLAREGGALEPGRRGC